MLPKPVFFFRIIWCNYNLKNCYFLFGVKGMTVAFHWVLRHMREQSLLSMWMQFETTYCVQVIEWTLRLHGHMEIGDLGIVFQIAQYPAYVGMELMVVDSTRTSTKLLRKNPLKFLLKYNNCRLTCFLLNLRSAL